jgi:hypothetical protein
MCARDGELAAGGGENALIALVNNIARVVDAGKVGVGN